MLIIGSDSCVYCVKAKRLLKSKGIDFEFVDRFAYAPAAALFEQHAIRTIPAIFHNDYYIGGYAELVEHLNKVDFL